MFNNGKSYDFSTHVTTVATDHKDKSAYPKRSIEKLRQLVPVESEIPYNCISVDNVKDLVFPEVCRDPLSSSVELPSPEAISLETLQFLVKEISNETKKQQSEKFKIWKIDEESVGPHEQGELKESNDSKKFFKSEGKTKSYASFPKAEPRKRSFGVQKSYSLDLEKVITPENDLQKQRKSNYKHKLRNSLRTAENSQGLNKQDSHTALEEKLKELTEGDNLEKWLETLNLPQRKSIDAKNVRKEIDKYFNCKSKTESAHDASLLKKFWSRVKGNNGISKQTLVVIGALVTYISVTAATAELLPLVWPVVLGIGTAGEEAIVDIGVEFFQQIPDPAFNLLHSHEKNAKPLSYAWTNQYILWKYMK